MLPQSFPRRVLLILGGIGGCLVVFVGLAVKYGGEPYLAEVALADGSHRLRLLQVSEGPLEYNWSPPALQRYLPFLGPHVPSIDVKLSGLDRWTGTPGTSFLFRTVDQFGAYTNGIGGPSLEFEFQESTGYVFKDRVGMPDYPHWGASGLTRAALPRRDKNLVIHIKQGQGAPVEMVIPNPLYRESFPNWQPESLPITRTSGPLTLKLVQVRSLGNRAYSQWDLSESGDDWKNGNVSYVLEDATGNIGDDLSPFEPAWKIRARTYRSSDAEFPAEVSSVLEKLPIMSPGEVTPLNRELTLDGITFRLVCLAGAGEVTETGGVFSAEVIKDPARAQMFTVESSSAKGTKLKVARQRPFLWIEPKTALPKHTQVVAQVTVSGTRKACEGSHMSTSDRNLQVFDLPDVGDLKEVDVTFSHSQPVELEFLVAPPEEFRKAVTSNSGKQQAPH